MKICMQKALENYDFDHLEDENSHPYFKSLLYASLFFHGILSVNTFHRVQVFYELNINIWFDFRNVKSTVKLDGIYHIILNILSGPLVNR